MRTLAVAAVLLAAGSATPAAWAQAEDAVPPAGAVAAQGEPPAPADDPAPAYDEDLDYDPAEPDFSVITLPTQLRMPRGKLAFRLTHRFARPLGEGDFSDLAADLFGFDGGAQIGLGLRFGLLRGTQLLVYRTSDRTIQLAAQHGLLREDRAPLGVSLALSLEGQNNFGLSPAPAPEPLHEFAPAVTLLLSHRLGSRGAVYAAPAWVGNTRVVPGAPGDADGTLLLGLGARFRVAGGTRVVAEVHPRLSGYDGDLGSGPPGMLASFGLEWHVGGHGFQIGVSNGLGTTPAQVARGRDLVDDWFVGFNLGRKFY